MVAINMLLDKKGHATFNSIYFKKLRILKKKKKKTL
jgi:hypothetical protein